MYAPFSKHAYHSNDILSHLQKVKRLGDGRYIALCPCHNDKTPSLGVTLKPDGRWLLHCLGCGANGLAVCNTLGIDPISLYPSNNNPRYEKQTRSGFSAWQLLTALEPDLVRLLIIANGLKAIDALSDDDREFVSEVVIRINDGLQYLEGKK